MRHEHVPNKRKYANVLLKSETTRILPSKEVDHIQQIGHHKQHRADQHPYLELHSLVFHVQLTQLDQHNWVSEHANEHDAVAVDFGQEIIELLNDGGKTDVLYN